MKDLESHIVQSYASKWRNLGLQLRVDYQLMENIECDHPNDCERCCSKMLAEWLQSNPAACWEDLITAIDGPLLCSKYGHCYMILVYMVTFWSVQ